MPARPRLLIVIAALALTACGADTTSTPTAQPTGAAASGSCTPAPSGSGTSSGADSFSTSVCLISSPDGLKYGDIVTGTGATPQSGQMVTVQYTGWLNNGTVFDSSRNPGRGPFSFAIGTGAVISGWDEGVATIHVGGKRRLVIPPQLAYGSQGQGPIPPNATLTFDVQLLSVGGASPS